MADNEGLRTTGEAIVKCVTPDVCKTPPSMAPVPYEIIGRFNDGIRYSNTVCMTGLEVMTTDSRLPKVYGDEAGVGGGVTSGVNVGFCRPITHSPTVRAQGHFIVFHSAEYWMNCNGPEGPGNTKGTVVFVENIDAVHIGPLGEIEAPAPVEPETEKETSWLDWVHTGLDVVGLVPVLGELADGANAVIHGVEAGVYAISGNSAKAKENVLMAGLSAAAMWPAGGQAATATKFGIKAGKELLEEGVEKVVKEGVEEGLEKTTKEAAENAVEKETKEEIAEQGTGAAKTVDKANNGVKVTNSGKRTTPLNRSQARQLADTLGYKEAKDPPFSPHGQPVFQKGNRYITPDKDVHKGGTWKMFDHKGNRIGTYNDGLSAKIGD